MKEALVIVSFLWCVGVGDAFLIAPSTIHVSQTSTLLHASVSSSEAAKLVTQEFEEIHSYDSPTGGELYNDSESIQPADTLEETLLHLPRHSHAAVNSILESTEETLRGLHKFSLKLDAAAPYSMGETDPVGGGHEIVFANSYVDFGKVDTVGFDYDYTLLTYRDELLELIYNMALKRLVRDYQYPLEMLESGLSYDKRFSVRGLAVDRETGWICHLSYTHKVAVAWEGREKVSTERLSSEYRGKRALRPSERRKRIKPLNDLFSMAECCLIADTVQFFKDNGIPFCARNAVNDILKSIGETHVSGDFHRMVMAKPSKYINPTPHLKDVLDNLRAAGKSLILVSNSPFWFVDAGMQYVIGEDWRASWDTIITSAGKPAFYTDNSRPFREVCLETGRTKFSEVKAFRTGRVYTEGCSAELVRLMDMNGEVSKGLAGSNVLYVGDSLFADLVDAKREFGWMTAAVTPEVGYEMELQREGQFVSAQRSTQLLLNSLRILQEELGSGLRSEEDNYVMDSLEKLVSKWRDRESKLMGSPFGSVFSARYQPSLFAHSLRRYSDLYMSSVSSLRHYSPQHRFYPDDSRLLSHENGGESECWDLEDVLDEASDF